MSQKPKQKVVAKPDVSMLDVSKLRPHPKNPRTHPDAQVDGLGQAFAEFGMLQPVVVDEHGTILAGEGRWRAAVKSGLAKLPGITVRGWTEEKKLKFVLADNRWALLGGIDELRERAAILELQAAGVELSPIGYDITAVRALLADVEAPSEFAEFGEDIPTEHQCPKCGYRWSGKYAGVVPKERKAANGKGAKA